MSQLKHLKKLSPSFLVGLGFALSAAAAENWPHWRGPHDDGVAPDANPPTTWSESKNVKWKVKIPGDGTATPIIWENKVFVQTAIPTGRKGQPNALVGSREGGSEANRLPPGPAGGPPGFGPAVPLAPRVISSAHT